MSDNLYEYYPGMFTKPHDFENKQKNIQRFVREMLTQSMQIFEYTNLPENITPLRLERILQTQGRAFITETADGLNVFFGQTGGPPNLYYEDTLFLISNPNLPQSLQLKIGEEGVLIKNDSMMNDLVYDFVKYGTLLEENLITHNSAYILMRAHLAFSAGDDKTMKGAEEYIRQIEAGRMSVIAESQLLEGVKLHSHQGGISLTELRESFQFIESVLYAKIGVKSSRNAKSQYVNHEEIGLGDDALIHRIQDMLNNRKEALDEVNAMYGTDIQVDLKGTWKRHELEIENEVKLMEEGVILEEQASTEATPSEETSSIGESESEVEEADEVESTEETAEVEVNITVDVKEDEEDVESEDETDDSQR